MNSPEIQDERKRPVVYTVFPSGGDIICPADRSPDDVGWGCEFCVNAARYNWAEKSLSRNFSIPTCAQGDSCAFMIEESSILRENIRRAAPKDIISMIGKSAHGSRVESWHWEPTFAADSADISNSIPKPGETPLAHHWRYKPAYLTSKYDNHSMDPIP